MVRLRRYDDGDLPLLRRTNTPEMTEFLGGPEPEDKLLDRHRRYFSLDGPGAMFVILYDEEPAGTVGFWEKAWHDEQVYETGWGVLPEFQGHGIAAAAAVLVADSAGAEGLHRWLHAYPKVVHAASNAICRKAGFSLLGEVDFEYPKGTPIRCNDWRLDLEADSQVA
jgi:RimJ/RimL family protein N-acetyltransferase